MSEHSFSARGAKYHNDDFEWDCKAKVPLKVLIVGAGVAGLTAGIGLKQAGHDVTIFEQVGHIAEVGAGIQLAPNNTRIMGRFGVLEDLMKNTNLLARNSIRRWKNDEELGTSPLMPKIADIYHAPVGVIHRGDLQRVLLEHCKANGVEILTGHHVAKVDGNFEARVQLADGSWIDGDLVIAGDGIKSGIRQQIASAHNHTDHSMPTGDAAYRILIPKEKLEHDKRALELLNENVGMRWLGPGGHIMAYPIKNNTVYNMVLLHPQKPTQENDESWTRKGEKSEMLDFYKDWNDTVKNLLSYVPEGDVMEWTLNGHRPLPGWHENKVVLIGDACHPMLPYVAQGAAQAMEDGAVLQAVLSQITSKDGIPTALKVYELIRKERAERVQNSASTTRTALHLPDGPEQQHRDEMIRKAARGEGQNPDAWADTDWQKFMWGTDVMRDVVEGWDELKAKVEGTHVHHAVGF